MTVCLRYSDGTLSGVFDTELFNLLIAWLTCKGVITMGIIGGIKELSIAGGSILLSWTKTLENCAFNSSAFSIGSVMVILS